MSFFDEIFDFDNDGELDAFEEGAQLGMIMDMIESDEDGDGDDEFDADEYDY